MGGADARTSTESTQAEPDSIYLDSCVSTDRLCVPSRLVTRETACIPSQRPNEDEDFMVNSAGSYRGIMTCDTAS
jgi:hypothetical protein